MHKVSKAAQCLEDCDDPANALVDSSILASKATQCLEDCDEHFIPQRQRNASKIVMLMNTDFYNDRVKSGAMPGRLRRGARQPRKGNAMPRRLQYHSRESSPVYVKRQRNASKIATQVNTLRDGAMVLS
jgi:hypothetical protein